MKRIFFNGAMVAILAGGIFWSCQKDDVIVNPEESLMLKSAGVENDQNCTPVTYQLITGRDTPVGELVVSNDETNLKVEYVTTGSNTISEVHLWVGLDATKVPGNRRGIPNPEKFTYKAADLDEYILYLNLTDFLDPEVACQETDLAIFAHAVIVNSDTHKKETARSQGAAFETSHRGWITYTTCCTKTGEGGCFSHIAYGGDEKGTGSSLWYFYDTKKGKQPVFSDNNVIVGDVEYTGETMTINLQQDWQLDDDVEDPVKIQGYDKVPTKEPDTFTTYEGANLNIDGLPYSDYYIILLYLDNCY